MAEKRDFDKVKVEYRSTFPSLRPKVGGPSGASRSDFTYVEKGAKPENQFQFLNSLAGKQVKLTFVNGTEAFGTLLWHDNFCICIQVENVGEKMIFKGSLAWIENI